MDRDEIEERLRARMDLHDTIGILVAGAVAGLLALCLAIHYGIIS